MFSPRYRQARPLAFHRQEEEGVEKEREKKRRKRERRGEEERERRKRGREEEKEREKRRRERRREKRRRLVNLFLVKRKERTKEIHFFSFFITLLSGRLRCRKTSERLS